jgi:hypothetical protein
MVAQCSDRTANNRPRHQYISLRRGLMSTHRYSSVHLGSCGEKRVSVYEEAPGFRLSPRIWVRTEFRVVHFFLTCIFIKDRLLRLWLYFIVVCV